MEVGREERQDYEPEVIELYNVESDPEPEYVGSKEIDHVHITRRVQSCY